MKFHENSVTDINIAYIGGGSKEWAWKLMSDLSLDNEINGTVKLYDIDFVAAKNNEEIGNRISKRSDCKSKWKYTAVKKIEDALIDSDFVIISILPGTFKEMESDVHLQRNSVFINQSATRWGLAD